mmetsp:Transcript_11095/g.19320  ORF Transcript_11095/g.19320 Transcript_11095/m.19320 type:complete len:115 (-) Transcript_11095:1020-1364(-)|eukprot:CAMPEP_0119106888 /NCGR_PEP_ID=MMETSP1180-20130426/6965_1 /TAXON_ID=3052 ORGANISM="Chlamydomonas cf sp, Strain CCMP681" /NCGR_SAMPLE_ID=MMETSP1180 /ASSEMBLY_ACC=CAM_ASM_000741 /LENGTH=114 /DNA_ID=CAMNT_0007092289 /DNA_START=22 /DNA_END=366 /DNA_ORIENTATION=-
MKLALLGPASDCLSAQGALESHGHTASVPEPTDQLRQGLDRIVASEACLVLNPARFDIEGFVSAATLMELAVAFYHHKPIYLLYPTPSDKGDIFQLEPKVLHGNLLAVPMVLYG